MACANHLPEFDGRDDLGAYFVCKTCGEIEFMDYVDFLDWIKDAEDDDEDYDSPDYDDDDF